MKNDSAVCTLLKARCGLHQPAELNGVGEVGRADDDVGEDDRDLRVARGQEGELLRAGHDPQPVADDGREALAEALAFGGFAPQQRDLLGVLAHAHEVEAEVGLIALLEEIQRDQRPADEMGEQRADHRIDQRGPDQIARDIPSSAEERERRRLRESPTG